MPSFSLLFGGHTNDENPAIGAREPGARLLGGAVEGALLTRGVRGVLGRWGPTGLGPKEAALLDTAAVGDGGMVRLPGVALRVAVRLGPGDPLLLPPPGVVVRGVADVVVDERVGLLVVRVHLVLAVAPLAGQRTGCQWPRGDRSACSALGGTEGSALSVCLACSQPWTLGLSAPALPGGRDAPLGLPFASFREDHGTEPVDF